MTTEERLTALERSHDIMAGIQANLSESQVRMARTQNRIVELLAQVVEMTAETRLMVEAVEARTEEIKRETEQTRRIWVAFARHHGWPEDLDSYDSPEE